MKAIDLDRVMEIVTMDDFIGICRECGSEQSGVEPDARKRECECCGRKQVFGAEELLIMGAGL